MRKIIQFINRGTAPVNEEMGFLKTLASQIPTQMCQFHQIQIINRYLTTRPNLKERPKIIITKALTFQTPLILLDAFFSYLKDCLRVYRE